MKTDLIKNGLLGDYSVTTLDNGLSVYIMEKPGFDSCYAAFGTKYGSINTKFCRNGGEEIEVPAGIAHFLEHKLFESEEGDTFQRFAKTGAYCNAYTSFDRTCYIFSCSSNFSANLDILLDFVQTPYFTAETVKKEQGIIAQEIKMYEDNPGWRVFFNLLRQMYENHPVKIDIAGTVESISEIDDKLLFECYNTFYNPANMFICIAGNIKTAEVLSQIEKNIKKVERVTVKSASFCESKMVKNNFVEQSLEVAKPLFCLGFKDVFSGERLDLKSRTVAGIALELLCGDCSALYRRLQDSGLIDNELSAEHFQGEGYSAFIIEGESENPKAVAEEIKKEIKSFIKNGVDTELLDAVLKAAYGDAVKRFDNTDSIVTDMIDCAISSGGLFDTAHILKEINEQDIIACLSKLTDEASVLSVITPRKEK
ncbi:MAG: insulinase family protein [Clostridia bacterium]|nr:insulinase family protein [Clostridia bacterium]